MPGCLRTEFLKIKKREGKKGERKRRGVGGREKNNRVLIQVILISMPNLTGD